MCNVFSLFIPLIPNMQLLKSYSYNMARRHGVCKLCSYVHFEDNHYISSPILFIPDVSDTWLRHTVLRGKYMAGTAVSNFVFSSGVGLLRELKQEVKAAPDFIRQIIKEAIVAKTKTSKEGTICPFSGGPCRQCGVYRGRHFELCASHNASLKEIRAAKAKVWTDRASTKLQIPKIPDGVKIKIVNVENCVENRDL